MNYNYISCIDSRRKPDIYIGGKINLPAKNYRFADIIRKELKKNFTEENQKSKLNEDNLFEDKKFDYPSNKITDSIKKSKNYSKEENEGANKIDDMTKFEEIEENIEELRKKGNLYESDSDIGVYSYLKTLIKNAYFYLKNIFL